MEKGPAFSPQGIRKGGDSLRCHTCYAFGLSSSRAASLGGFGLSPPEVPGRLRGHALVCRGTPALLGEGEPSVK
eukprot:4283404-Pyramimonas_sp.AAC.1